MILYYVKDIYNWVADDIFIIESLCCEKYIYNWVADDTMLCEIYL